MLAGLLKHTLNGEGPNPFGDRSLRRPVPDMVAPSRAYDSVRVINSQVDEDLGASPISQIRRQNVSWSRISR